ncbi:DNA (Cytosine-5)-methyltransferase DRM1/2 isoform 2 [Hibiscus syriacus]|uniref:DNA (Cytosine-5)-methyltransferase DRM1/2 isoform 2 n=1 Tax=Hibiscus syriacus TaxID=106335 RepID=A0A6A2ZTY8_HIBSY|nr:DNA (Cytosine-5)-methyltransferase DRM1/2 isoform 2 [Hibiscus syriacus]
MQHVDSDNYSSDYEAIFQDDFTNIDSSSDTEEIMNSDEENKLLYLTKIGYSDAEASIAMERCDPDSSIAELTDFICAAQMVRAADTLLPVEDRKPLCNNPNYKKSFGVFTESDQITQRTLPENAIGPPYFYYENVALAPIEVWTKMSRKWWPSWDPRTKLNCLKTCTGSAKLTEMICKALEAYDDEPPLSVQKYVLDEYRKWNLVWVGRNKVVPLEPDEVEMLLGFPKNHTRGVGFARDMFPVGINVLSLFSGISDAEVTFYCLGISLKTDE